MVGRVRLPRSLTLNQNGVKDNERVNIKRDISHLLSLFLLLARVLLRVQNIVITEVKTNVIMQMYRLTQKTGH